jgi:LysM repeat protein
MVLNSDGTQGTYTVQSGDSLWTIAEDKLGVGNASNDADFQTRVANLVAQLTADNNITNPDMIYPGQQLTFTNLQNSAYDSSSYDASSTSASTGGTTATDATTPSPVTASSGVIPAGPDSSPDSTSSPVDSTAGQAPTQADSVISQPGPLVAQSPGNPSSTPEVANYNTVPLPPQDQDLAPPAQSAMAGNGDDSGN